MAKSLRLTPHLFGAGLVERIPDADLLARVATRPDGEAVTNLLDDSEHKIFSIARGAERGSADPIKEILTETFKRIDAASHRGGLTGLTTGYLDLDQLLCGFNAGDLVILAARAKANRWTL